MTLKRSIFWAHLIVGVATGLVIFVLALTGLLLTYESQIQSWFNPVVAPSVEHAEMMPADDLIAVAKPVFPGQATTLEYSNNPYAPLAVKAGRHDFKWLDPYSGEMLSETDNPVGPFFHLAEGLHRNLALGFDSIGGSIVKASNLAFLFIILSGMYLWLPRKWKWSFLKQKIFFARNLPTSKARDYNWHHVFSFWVLIPLVAVVGSGVLLSYQWANQVVFAAAGLEAPQGRGRGKGMWARGSGSAESSLAVDQLVSYQALLEKAKDVEEDWRSISIILPASDKAKQVDMMIDTGNGRQAATQQTITYSREDGSVAGHKGPDEMATPTQSLRRYIRFLHTGEVYGIVGQTLAGIASLASLFLVWTGLALAWRRLISPLFGKPKAKPVA